MIFRESLSEEDLKEPMIYEFHGNYVRLTPIENDQLSYGTVFDEPEDDTIFFDRKKLIELLDQLKHIMKNDLRPIYLIKDNKQLEFTNQFPTKYALFIQKKENYNLSKCDDPDLELLALFLSHYKQTKNYKTFFDDKRIFIKKIDWNLENLKLEGFGNKILLLNPKNREIKIEIKDLIVLMIQWQTILKEDPEKIYLVLENGEYRLTTNYSPE